MEYKKLGDIATFINGYAFKPSDRGEVGLPIIRIQDLTGNGYDLGFYNGEYPKKVEINNGDILISWSASLGVYVWNNGKALLNQHIFKVVFDKVEIEKYYFVFAIQYYLDEMKRKTHGATMKHIVKKDFDCTLIPYPSVEKQREISNILLKVKYIIDTRKKQLEKYDELIKARFVEMFGDPNCNKNNLVKISDIGLLMSGGTPPRKEVNYFNGEIRWYSAGELNSLYLGDSIEHISNKAIEESSAKLFKKSTLMIGMYDTAAFKMGILTEESSSNQACANLQPSDRYNVIWLYYLFDIMKPKFLNERQGVRQKNLSLSKIKGFMVPYSETELQNQFADFVKQIDKSKFVVQKSLDKAQLLFDSLMQEYFG